MADSTLIAEGLTRLAGSLDGLPLLASKSLAGAYPATRPGKEAAAFCEAHGLVRPLPPDTVARVGGLPHTLSDAGLAWLRQNASATPALESLGEALQARVGHLNDLTRQIESQKEQLIQMANLVGELAARARNEAATQDASLVIAATILAELKTWQRQNPLKDCSLPELYRKLQTRLTRATIGEFHDACRRLVDARRIYLHPWTGPLYEMPEPALAFLCGHEIAYYASLREATQSEDAFRTTETQRHGAETEMALCQHE